MRGGRRDVVGAAMTWITVVGRASRLVFPSRRKAAWPRREPRSRLRVLTIAIAALYRQGPSSPTGP